MAPELPHGLQRGNVRYFPVAPGRLEFAGAVRELIRRERPHVVAVELPAGLEAVYRQAVARLPEMSVIFYADPTQEDSAVYIPVEPADPFVEAIRTALEGGAEVIFLDPDCGERPHLADHYPDTFAIDRIGVDRYVEAYRVYPQPRSEETARFAAGLAWKLQGADPLARVLVVVSLNLLDPLLDAMETPQEEPPAPRKYDGLELFNLHPECLAEVTVEYPYLQDRYERFRAGDAPAHFLDRRRVQFAVYREAEESYHLNTGEKVAHWQRRLLARYTRNLALVSGGLAAGIFDIAVAGRSLVDDNFAWDVWEIAGRYAEQKTESDLRTVNISGEEVWLNTRRIRLRRRLPSMKRRLRPAGLKPRKKEKVPGEWARQLNGNNICSYPPEDLVIEDYGRYLKKKGKSILSEERTRVEPFTTSLLDGIDIRETIRNWHQRRIYVRHYQKVSGEVGSVVVIFDEDAANRYDYLTTWLGEHQNESDMAFYSTHPFANLVGPGIGRGEYGGFLMSLPARRMYDVWADPDYDFAENKAERLLLAGLDYSIHRYVVYVAAKPPRSIFRDIAARYGRTLVYIPIGQLSPVALKKVRVVHVLDGYDKRAIAKQFLW
ncbi:MAG: hypothetical protein HYR60_27230 [Acidobacteria bacterium]|nr:hypothetical protein [Acidobacteriota bacterium]